MHVAETNSLVFVVSYILFYLNQPYKSVSAIIYNAHLKEQLYPWIQIYCLEIVF